MDIGRFLDIAERRFPDKLAVVSEEKRYTYRQFKERVQRLMTVLVGLGVKKGDRVATIMLNSSELVEVYLAAIGLGAVFAPLNYRLKKPELGPIVKDSLPRVLITDEKCQELASQVVCDVSGLRHLVSSSDQPMDGFSPYEDLLAGSQPYKGGEDIAPDDACQLVYTSGTTGRPKGVILSHENLVWNTMNMLQVRCDRPQDVALIVGPLFHVAALNSHYTSRLALGATSVIMARFDPLHLMKVVQQEKITVVSGTPTMFTMLMENCSPGDYDTSSVDTLTSGADRLADHIKTEILEFFPGAKGIYDVYGSTECICVTTLSAKDSLSKHGSVGRPLPFLEIRVLGDNGQDVPIGQTGEIVVRGGNVMKGYYRQYKETEKFFRNGWFCTEDLARADEDGYIYIVDRKKDIIITGGENVFSREVEGALSSHQAILKAAVFGLPHPKWGKKVSAAVVLRDRHFVTSEQLRDYLKERLAGYKIPKEFFFVDQLPESSTGKIQKKLLRQVYASKEN